MHLGATYNEWGRIVERHKISVLFLMNGICAFSKGAVGRFETSAKQGDGMACGLRCHPEISISSCIMKKDAHLR